ncbi:MAG: galactokinase [Anaerolineae bacterium]|nr:galactokinase [Anaerolineae bacterium]
MLARAPGRVNLIGEHTDYNDGFVLPIAIDRDITIVAAPARNGTGRVRLYSTHFDQRSAFDLNDITKSAREPWSNYIRGVLWVLQGEGHPLTAFDAVVAGDVPLGAGLSSSAALEVATLELCSALNGLPLDQKTKALLGQRAENRFVGVQCGIMDQLIAATGVADHAVLIDCRSLEGTPVPLPEGVSVVVINSMVERGLVDSAYNERRRQCEEAARLLGVPALRDVTREAFARGADALPPVVRQRAAHVVEENDRTLRAAEALRAGDIATVGPLFNESHRSMRDLFEITVPAIDTLVALAQAQPGCYGSRMTGGGFGGCTVSLVNADAVPAFVAQVAAGYEATIGLQPEVYVCRAADGSEARAL